MVYTIWCMYSMIHVYIEVYICTEYHITIGGMGVYVYWYEEYAYTDVRVYVIAYIYIGVGGVRACESTCISGNTRILVAICV